MSTPTLPGRTFEGVSRADGTVGVRDNVLILPSVICSHLVAERIADRVDNAVATPHDHGCAQLGVDNEQTRRTLVSIAQNPNIAGTVVIGLGCEEVQSSEVATALESFNTSVRELSIQDVGGTDECVERGIGVADELAQSRHTTRTVADLSDLTLGIVSSDLDSSTVNTADPLVGSAVDAVISAGGRVIVAGNERLAVNPDEVLEVVTHKASKAMSELIERHEGQPARATRVGQFARNRPFEDVTRAWGSKNISEVLSYGERTNLSEGLSAVDAPSRFIEATTALAAAGANIAIHVTGDGILSGHPLLPVIKVTGDPGTAAALPNDIDLSAQNASPDDLLQRLVDVANGNMCLAEAHGLTEFAITRVGPSM